VTETTFEKAYLALNTAQRQAVDTIDGPLLVIAGPGTGKTQLLSVRVANIMRRTDIRAENILCLTFTESGQKAIKKRLKELMGSMAEQVGIHTFHGFGSAIINANPDHFFGGEIPRAADDLTLFEILYNIFERLPHGNPLSSQNGDEFVFLKDAQTRITELKAAGVTPDQLRSIVANDQQWCSHAIEVVREHFTNIPRLTKNNLPLVQALAQDLTSLEIIEHTGELFEPIGQSCLDELCKALDTAAATGTMAAASGWKRRWLETIDEQLHFKSSTQAKRLLVLADIYEEYLTELRKRLLYDYDDMILEVLSELRREPDLLATLQEQYQYIMVDEYQDTNGAQAQLVDMLANNPVHEGRPNVMVVGDDDQAIYGFQGADSTVMLAFRERWREVETIVLKHNYRSSQPILDAARQIIQQGNLRLENIYDDVDKQLLAQASLPPKAVRLMSFTNEDEQYQWLVNELAGLSSKRSVAVIAPRHKYLQRLVPYVLGAGLGISYERQANALSEPATCQLLQICRVLDAIHRKQTASVRALLPEIFSYRIWSIPVRQIWEISFAAHAARTGNWLPHITDEQPEVQAVLTWLENTAQEVAALPLEDCLQIIVKKISTADTRLALHVSLKALARHLETYRPDKPSVLRDFVNYVNLCEQAGIAIDVTSLTAQGDRNIRLMTAHKSKGLEFDHVYLIDTSQHIWCGEKGMINKISWPPNLRALQPPGETEDDRLRLFYVAATRAKSELNLSWFATASDGKQYSLLNWLATPPVNQQLDQTPPVTTRQITPKISVLDDWRQPHHQLLANPQAREMLGSHLENYHLSPTHLTTFLDVSRGGPRLQLVQNLLHFPSVTTLNMLFGNFVHTTLEFVQQSYAQKGQLPSLREVMARFKNEMEEHYLRDIDHEKLYERGKRSLTAYLEQRAQSFDKRIVAELDFSNQKVQLDGARLTGKIDRILLDPATQSAIVTDFKTGKSFSRWQGASDYDKHKLHNNQHQLGFYKLLVEHSRQYGAFKVEQAQLEFVEPDKWGKINTLDYNYDPDEMARLKQLITVVWQHIMDLNLPDTSHYPQDYKGTLEFEEDLLSGKI
jgi:DNA helicase II / ATP-dependent DNA helicase PcrA